MNLTNHPNRRRAGCPAQSPTPAELRAARERAGLTPSQMADDLCVAVRTAQSWETPADNPSHRPMPAGLWKLLRLLYPTE